MKRLIFLILGISACAHEVYSQNSMNPKVSIDGLVIGNEVPNVLIANIVNYHSRSARISDFRGKLLILDFWATWCGPCIAAFSKNDSLQKKFADQIQIMAVTKENETIVNDFLKKMSKLKGIMPPTATNDSRLTGYFRYLYMPHYIWIDKDGKLIAITDQSEVSEKNIRDVLYGKKVAFKFKKDVLTSILKEDNKPLFTPGVKAKVDTALRFLPLNDSLLVKHSIFTRHIDGILSGTRINDSPSIVIGQNMLVQGLYSLAFWGGRIEVLNRYWTKVEIEDEHLYEIVNGLRKDGSRFLQPGNESLDYLKKYGYYYELVVPDFLAKVKCDIMLRDLNDFFGALYNIEGVKEKRLIKYLALVRVSTEDKLATKGGNEIDKADKFSVTLQNQDLSSLIWALALPLQAYPPVFDETNYKGKVDLELTYGSPNLNNVNRELLKYGLQLEEKEKMIEIGVIRDKKHNP